MSRDTNDLDDVIEGGDFVSPHLRFRGARQIRILDAAETSPAAASGAATATATLQAAIDAFFDDIVAREQALARGDVPPLPRLHVVRMPVGFGKTEVALRAIAKFTAEHSTAWASTPDRQGHGKRPLVFAAPNYRLLEEIEERLDDVDASLAVGWLKGKIAGGCLRPEDVQLLTQLNLPSHLLCEDGIGERCPHFDTCPVQARLAALNTDPFGRGRWRGASLIADAAKQDAEDVVLMPHAMLTVGDLPQSIRDARGLVIDESIVAGLLKTDEMPLSVLMTPRPLPPLMPWEADQGISPEDLVIERDIAAGIAYRALLNGQHLGQTLISELGSAESAISHVASALTVCDRARLPKQMVNPQTSRSALLEMLNLSRPIHLTQEAQLWRIIREQIEEISEGRIDPTQDRRLRLHVTAETQVVQMSWRNALEVLDRPLLVLDASADAQLYQILFGGSHDIRFTEVSEQDVGLKQRNVLVTGLSFSKTSLLRSDGSDKRLDRLQKAVAAITARHSAGKLLCVAVKNVVKEIQTWDFAGRERVDFAHYGAVKGLDFARDHKAAILVGALELPSDVLERQALALSYDQPEPTPPGAERAASMELEETTLHLRDGRTAIIRSYVNADRFARLLQRQFREEEMVQAYGRLRAIRKTSEEMSDWQVVYILSSVCPSSLVLDDVIHIDDLTEETPIMKAARLHGEAVSSAALVAAGLCKSRDGDPLKAARAASKMLRDYGFVEGTPPEGWAEAKIGRKGVRGKPVTVWVFLADLSDQTMAKIENKALQHLADLEGGVIDHYSVKSILIEA